MTSTAPVFNARKAWTVTIVSVLSAISYGLVLYKAMTTLTLMLTYFSVDYTTYGVITGIVGLFALVSGLPAGIIVGKIGARNMLVSCLALNFLGMTVQIAMLLLLGRSCNFIAFMLWGIPGQLAWGAVSIGGTILTTSWFPPQKRPLPMGCAGLFAPLSLLIILLCSTPIISMASSDGYTAEELAACFGQSPDGFVTISVFIWGYCLLFLILAFIFIKLPSAENSFLGVNAASEQAGAKGQSFNEGSYAEGFKNVGAWLIVIFYMLYMWGSMSYATYWPTYIESDPSVGGFNVDPGQANLMSTTVSFSMIAVSLIVGFALTKVNRKWWTWLVIIVTVMIAFNSFFMFNQPATSFFIFYLIIYGCSQELFPCVALTLLPEMVDSPKALGVAVGLYSSLMNVAATVCNATNGYIHDANPDFHALGMPLMIVGVLVLIVGFALAFTWNKRWKFLQKQAEEMAAENN
ncbi:MAG: MFS transporter [Coriobacteriales bacterium]|jgi:MFS family permease